MDENEIWLKDQTLILQEFLKEFAKRFKKDSNNNTQMEIPLSKDISDEKNDWLTREITMGEVWQAAKQSDPLKAYGSNVCM